VSTRAGTHVVVGGGMAAAHAVAGLREAGYTGRIVLVGAERHLPYERPPLSKGYLTGASSWESALVHPAEWYDEHGVELVLGTPATGLDPDGHLVTVGDSRMAYDRLLLATGSSARRLAVADDSGAPVAYLRTVDDADRIRSALRPGGRIVILGGGWIGLEVASAARSAGCDVVIVEPLAQPLLRVLGSEVGEAFAALHRSHGVDLRTGTSLTGITARPASGDATRAVVRLDDGSAVEADLLVVGIGAVPGTGLAEAAGLEVDNGVLTDEHLRTSHPDVFAAGDIASALHPVIGRRVRVEHWDNARAQGRTAARNMLGAEEAYAAMPYFFSDQYDLGMEYVGHVGPDGYDEVVLRGDPASGVFSAFWLQRDRVLAAMHANDWDAIDPIRALVGAELVDRRELADATVPLGDVVR
jgi:3-phenylpropionate/trans-cinnamate dioxygenase ferredoxin reductase subunit